MRQCRIYWSLLVQHHHTDTGSPDHTRSDCTESRAPGSNRITFETQSELNYGDSQHAIVSRNQRASFACVSIITALYTARTNATDKKGAAQKKEEKKKKRKFLTDLWPPGGPKGAALHAYRWGSNRVYDCIIFSFSSSPLHPSVDTRSHYAGADRPDITHSLAS